MELGNPSPPVKALRLEITRLRSGSGDGVQLGHLQFRGFSVSTALQSENRFQYIYCALPDYSFHDSIYCMFIDSAVNEGKIPSISGVLQPPGSTRPEEARLTVLKGLNKSLLESYNMVDLCLSGQSWSLASSLVKHRELIFSVVKKAILKMQSNLQL